MNGTIWVVMEYPKHDLCRLIGVFDNIELVVPLVDGDNGLCRSVHQVELNVAWVETKQED